MSTILRALKKLEHDKAARKPDPADMDLEFLENTPPAPRRSPLKGIVLVGLLVACGSAATYLFMSRTEKVPPPAAQVAPPARQVVFKPATSVLPPPTPQANRSSASAPSALPALPLQAEQKPAPPATKVQADTPPKQAPVAKPYAPKAPKPQVQTTPLPSLTVNGIALSDGEKRKAIVNGMSVSVGSVIGGARVEEIQGNRVRFSYGGKTFEVSVGNTGP